jgi:hypothetical protein
VQGYRSVLANYAIDDSPRTPGRPIRASEVGERVRLVTLMHHDLAILDDEICRLESIQNPFDWKVLPKCPE